MTSLRDRARWSDAQLLEGIAACDDRAFSAFYRRHLATVVGWCLRRTGDPELAADLTAEVFAAVLDGAARYEPRTGSAAGWLLGIARNVLGHSVRRGRVDARARRRLGVAATSAPRTTIWCASWRSPSPSSRAGLVDDSSPGCPRMSAPR